MHLMGCNVEQAWHGRQAVVIPRFVRKAKAVSRRNHRLVSICRAGACQSSVGLVSTLWMDIDQSLDASSRRVGQYRKKPWASKEEQEEKAGQFNGRWRPGDSRWEEGWGGGGEGGDARSPSPGK